MKRFLSSLSVTILAASAAVPAHAQRFLEVSKSDSGYTVEAEAVTLPEVLTAIGRHAGFTVHDSSPDREPIDVFEVEDATLESTLRQLLGTSNHLMVYRGGAEGQIRDGMVEKIVLLSPGNRERPTKPVVTSLAGPAGTERARTAAAPPAPAPVMGGEEADAPLDPDEYSADADAQLVYGEALQALEEERIEQVGIEEADDVAELEAAEDAAGQLPPELIEELRAQALAEAGGLPDPRAVGPPP